MISLLFATALIVAVAAQNQPDVIATKPRSGRQAEVRFFSQLSSQSNVLVNGQAYSGSASAAVKVNGQTLETIQVPTLTINRVFSTVDTGNSGVANVELTITGTNPAVVVPCGQVFNGDRTTFLVTQTVSPAPLFTPGTCTLVGNVASGSCTSSTLQSNGSVTINCQAIADKLSVGRSCTKVPVRFYNLNTGCPSQLNLPLKRVAGAGIDTEEVFVTGLTVPTTFTGQTLDLNRNTTYAIKTANLFAANTKARTIDAFINTAGDLDVAIPFDTAFLNFANLAYRANATLVQADNTFSIVVVRGTVNSIVLKDVVHFETNFGPSSAGLFTLGNFIEVAAGSTYTLFVFDNADSFATIFGDNSVSPVVAPTASAIASGSLAASLTANEIRIFRIVTSGSTVAVTDVPLNQATTPVTPAGSTRHIIWNNLNGESVKLANPSNECCNFLKDNRTAAEVDQATAEGAVLLPAPRNVTTTFGVFPGNANCNPIPAPITSATVQLEDTTNANVCATRGIFLAGRRSVPINTESCSSNLVSGTPSTCLAGSVVTSSSTRIVSLTGAPGDTTATTQIAVAVPVVTFCDCFVPPPPPCPDPSCTDLKVVSLIKSAITAGVAVGTNAVLTGVDSQVDPIGTNVRTILRNSKKIRDDIDTLADDLDDVADNVEDLL